MIKTLSAAQSLPVECPLCGGTNTPERPAFSKMLSLPDNLPHRVRKCRTCGFLFLGPYLNEREIEALYSGSYFSGAEQGDVDGSGLDYETDCAQTRVGKFARSLDDLLRLKPDARSVLDVGAATGEFLELAQQRGLEVHGIELSQWASERAFEKYGMRFSNEPFESFAPGRRYDLIHASHVLEHFPSPRLAAAKVAELLAPGGLAYIEVPYQFNAAEALAARLGLWKRPYSTFSLHHPNFFTPATLCALFEADGLRLKSLQCFNWDRYGEAPTSAPKRVARQFLKTIGQGQIIEGIFQHG